MVIGGTGPWRARPHPSETLLLLALNTAAKALHHPAVRHHAKMISRASPLGHVMALSKARKCVAISR